MPTGNTQHISETLGSLLGGLGIDKKLKEYEAVVQWENIVGTAIARVTKATRIVRGVLHVQVTTAPWRNELTIRKKEIIEKINSTLKAEIVKDIKFR